MDAMVRRGRSTLAIVIALLVLEGLAAALGGARAATVRTLYVDGKNGSDSHAGTSLGTAFKTVAKGLQSIYVKGVGRAADRLVIVGYKDYVYYEKLSNSLYLPATSSTPITIEAANYGQSGYVRPIISGALVVSRPGDQRWTRPDASKYPDVWQIPWTTAIPGYDAASIGYRQERLYQDISQPLVRPAVRPTLAQLQAMPASQYWNGTKLYVHLGLWSGKLSTTDPRQHMIEIPNYKGILIGSGSSYVTIRGLNFRHTNMAVGITGDAHHVTVTNVDASYNYGMGFWTASHDNVFRTVSGKRNTIQLIKFDNGAQYNLVDDATGIENIGQGIKLTGPKTAHNTIRNSTFSDGKNIPMAAGGYGGYVQGLLIQDGAHHNYIQDNVFDNQRRGIYLYQTSSSSLSLHDNVIRRNRFLDSSVGVFVWDARSSGDSTGAMTFSRNLYVNNTYAIEVEGKTSNKTFDHETIYDSHPASGLGAIYLKGSGGKVAVKNTIIRTSTAYGLRADTGSTLTVTYTTVSGAASGARSGNVTWGSTNKTTNPVFLSTTPSSSDYLTIGTSSPVYHAGSAGDPIGALAK